MKRIPVNIWDDYYDEENLPVGEKQETFMYVEDTNIPEDFRKEALEFLLNFINTNIKLDGVKMNLLYYDSATKYPKLVGTDFEYSLYKRWQINIENLSHKNREMLVEELNKAGLFLNDIPFDIYSES